MKSLSDFKRAMQVGTKWYRKHAHEQDFSIRTVAKVCSDHVYVANEDGKAIRLDFPKASEFAINEQGDAEIYWPPTYTYHNAERVEIPRQLVLTYRRA